MDGWKKVSFWLEVFDLLNLLHKDWQNNMQAGKQAHEQHVFLFFMTRIKKINKIKFIKHTNCSSFISTPGLISELQSKQGHSELLIQAHTSTVYWVSHRDAKYWMAGHWGAVRLFLLSWLLPSSIRNQAINQKHRHVTCCKKESRANHRYLCDLTSYILDLQIFFAMKCTHAQQKIQIKTKQNKTTTGLREKRMRGRSKDKDGAAEQQSSRKGKESRRESHISCYAARLQNDPTDNCGRWTSSMSLSLISKHHPYCARLPRPLTQSQCPCRRQTPH